MSNIKINGLTKTIEKNFALLAVLFSVIAIIYPSSFCWVKVHIPKLLGIIMFGMGITLEISNFKKVWKHKRLLVAGVSAQYLLMPLFALAVSFVFQLPKELMVGMVIVGACPSGTASNVMAYLGKADLALSVTLTFCTTIIAPVMTPALILLYLGETIHIPFWKMVYSVFWIVLFPLVDGLIIRHFLYKRIKSIISIFPSISILCIILIIACVVALNRELLLTLPIMVFLGVAVHNSLGLASGYCLGRLLKADEKETRTLAFEIGLQNSGLGVSLATQFFSVAAALPSTIFSIWHNLSGIFIARYWASKNKY